MRLRRPRASALGQRERGGEVGDEAHRAERLDGDVDVLALLEGEGDQDQIQRVDLEIARDVLALPDGVGLDVQVARDRRAHRGPCGLAPPSGRRRVVSLAPSLLGGGISILPARYEPFSFVVASRAHWRIDR